MTEGKTSVVVVLSTTHHDQHLLSQSCTITSGTAHHIFTLAYLQSDQMNTDADAKAAAASFQFPSGHLGHLSAEQQDGLGKYKAYCAEKGAYKPSQDGGLPSHDDATML